MTPSDYDVEPFATLHKLVDYYGYAVVRDGVVIAKIPHKALRDFAAYWSKVQQLDASAREVARMLEDEQRSQ